MQVFIENLRQAKNLCSEVERVYKAVGKQQTPTPIAVAVPLVYRYVRQSEQLRTMVGDRILNLVGGYLAKQHPELAHLVLSKEQLGDIKNLGLDLEQVLNSSEGPHE